MRLEGKVALITGAGSGIGRATAEVFAREGAKVAVVDLSDAAGEQTVEAIHEAGGDSIFIKADVSNAEDVKRMISHTVQTWGKIDILYNNAGIPMGATPIEEVEDEFFDRTMAVNVRSVHLGIKHVVPYMKQQGGGVILSTASTAGIRPRPGLSAYAASKAAVIGLTKSVAIDFVTKGIRCNSVCPGTVDSPSLQQRLKDTGDYEAARKAFTARQPMGLLGTAEEIASIVLWLASDDSVFATGQNFIVDGGITI